MLKSDDKTSKTDYSVSYKYNVDNVGKVTLVMVQQLNMYMMETTSQTIFDNGKSGNDNEDIFTNTNTMMMALYQK